MAYTPEQVKRMKARLVEEILKGKNLNAILRDDVDMEFPSNVYIYQWFNANHKNYDPEFLNNYVQACDIRADKIFDEMLELADSKDDIAYTDEKGRQRIDWGKVQRNKIQIDTRKWVLGRMKPKKYGDRITNVHEGGDKPIDVVDYTKLSPETLEEIAKQADAGKPESE